MFRIRPIIIFCLVMLLPSLLITEVAKASTCEFWIGTNSTGNLFTNLSQYSGGTSNNPFDGSNQTNFDFCMSNLAGNFTIHLLPGIYSTLGGIASGQGWNVKPGERILGSGIDASILQHPKWQIHNHAIMDNYSIISTQGWWFNPDGNVDLEDFTCDGNYHPNDYVPGDYVLENGIQLGGSSNIINRVKITNLAAYGKTKGDYRENWGIVINAASGSSNSHNLIECCWIGNFTCNYYCDMTAISMSGVGGDILSNTIVQTSSNTIYGFLDTGPGRLDYNTTCNVTLFSHTDNNAVNMANLSVDYNLTLNSAAALDWMNGSSSNCDFSYNTVIGAPYYDPADYAYIMINMHPNNLDGVKTFSNFSVKGNYFKSLTTNVVGYLLNLSGGDGVTISGNVVDPFFANVLTGCTNITMKGNYDFYGKYMTNLNDVVHQTNAMHKRSD